MSKFWKKNSDKVDLPKNFLIIDAILTNRSNDQYSHELRLASIFFSNKTTKAYIFILVGSFKINALDFCRVFGNVINIKR